MDKQKSTKPTKLTKKHKLSKETKEAFDRALATADEIDNFSFLERLKFWKWNKNT